MRKLPRRVQYWMNRRRLEQELAEEIETHRSLKEEEFTKAGLSPGEAAASSRRAMGNEPLTPEDSRGAWISPWLEQPWQDTKYGLRQLRRNPGVHLHRRVDSGNRNRRECRDLHDSQRCSAGIAAA